MLQNIIFISYCRKDKYWLDRLQVHLTPLLRGSSVIAWDDTKIRPGTEWREEINKAMASAKVAVLLVSPDFIASDFIIQEVLPYLKEAADKNQLTIIPVAVRPCEWRTTPFELMQWANDPEKPLSSLRKTGQDKELCKIIKSITFYLPAETLSVRSRSETVESASRSAEEGLNALLELMRNPQVHGKVATFKADFKTSSKHIEILAYNKDLHDLLHTLQFQCYNYLKTIVHDARKEPDNRSIWNHVVNYEHTLQIINSGLHKALQQPPPDRIAPSWIEKIIQYLELLFQALEQKNAEQINIAIKPIQRILASEPVPINVRLVAAAQALQMPELIEALTKVLNSLDGAGVDPVTVEIFRDGVQAIKELNESLNKMIDSHNKWQEIDSILRLIEGNIAIDFSDLEYSWDELKTKTETQCDSCDDIKVQLLKRNIDKLDQALTAGEPEPIREHFETFRSRANSRFFDVDVALKGLCEQLRKVGEPLTHVWEMIVR
jgi:hypothetical protein